MTDPCDEIAPLEDLETAARAAVALDGLIAEKDLTGLAYYYEADPGSEMRTLMTNLIVGNSLLTGGGFPMCGEFDIKNLSGHAHLRPARDRRQLCRISSGRFCPGHGVGRSRRTPSHQHRGRQARAARPEKISRQTRPRRQRGIPA